MFCEGVKIFIDPGVYELLGRQCDNIASQIMDAGNQGYEVEWEPNATYDTLAEKNEMHWSN